MSQELELDQNRSQESGQIDSKNKKNRLVEHAGLLLGATLIAGVANYLFHIFMARLLGPQEYGILFSLISIFMIFSFPLSTVQMVLTKYVAHYRGMGNDSQIRFLVSDFLKKLGGASLVLLLIALVFSGPISHYLQIPSKGPIILLGMFTLISFLMPITFGMLQGLEHFFYLSLSSAVGALAKLGLGLLFIWLGFRVNGALTACLLAVFVTLILSWIPLKKFFQQTPKAQTPIHFKEIYKYFLPVFGALCFFGLLSYSDVILVKHWFDPSVAGTYAAAALLGKAFLFPAQSLAMAMFPKVTQLHVQKKDTIGLLKHTLLLALLVLGGGLAFVWIFPEFLASLLLKKGGVEAGTFKTLVNLIRYYSLAYIPLAATYILMFYSLGCHKKRFVLVLGGGAVVNLLVLHLCHETLWQVLTILGGVSITVFTILLIGIFRKNERV